MRFSNFASNVPEVKQNSANLADRINARHKLKISKLLSVIHPRATCCREMAENCDGLLEA